MADVSVDEIIEVFPHIANGMIKYLEEFHISLLIFEKKYLSNNGNSKDIIDRNSNDVREWLKNYEEDLNKSVSKNANFLETLKAEIKQMKRSQDTILENIAQNENELKCVKERQSDIEKKKTNLTDMRDKVQICKLLTNASFAYRGSKVQGYVVGQVSKQIKPFDMDPETVSKKDIINSLYSTVKKVSCDVKPAE